MRRAVAALGPLAVLAAAWQAQGSPVQGFAGIAFERIVSTDPNTGAYHSNVWITTARGSVRTLVKRRGLAAVDASWSPNGKALVFAADCSFKYRLACSSVWRMSANGTGLRKLSDGTAQDYCPAWSPRGTTIAFKAVFEAGHSQSSGVYLMHADGSTRIAVDRSELDGCPAWSPDGTRLTFSREGSLWVMKANGLAAHAVATNVGHDDAEPDWSGSRIAFTRQTRTGPRISVVAASGSRPLAVAAGSSPAFSPDGRMIAFARGGEIYVVGVRGGRPVRATRLRMRTAGHPAWRPR